MDPTFRGVPVVLDSDVNPVYWWNGVKLATIDTSSAEPAPADKPEKRIDEMTLADYRAGIAKVFNGGRLLP